MAKGIWSISCMTSNTKEQLLVDRRSANYMPSVWDYNFVKSLSADYAEERYVERVQRMKEEVKCTLERESNLLAKLELIDAIQRLGLQYRFDNEIKKALRVIQNHSNDAWFSNDLHSTALRFRLLRQHGYNVSQDVFEGFMDKMGSFEASLADDVKGLLSLYEASFHGLEGEGLVDEAKAFTCKHLNLLHLEGGIISSCREKKISHALELPIHWRPNRLEARWFMDIYEEDPNMNRTLLEMAKLDFNVLQSIYQKEVSGLARWWLELGVNELGFSRDRLVEHYLWSCLMVPEPEYGFCRVMLTKITCMITLIDDVYDVFGTLEELELLTDFIERWDVTDIEKLPLTIRISFLALFNTTNEVGFEILKEQGFNATPYIRRMVRFCLFIRDIHSPYSSTDFLLLLISGHKWVNECRAYIKEAKCYHKGYVPTLEEYLPTSVTSTGGPLMLFCIFLLTTKKLTHEALDYVSKTPRIIYISGLILRLNDDLGTSPDEMLRGDNPKGIECYMNENGASREAAVKHIEDMIWETWKAMNEQAFVDRPFPGMEVFIGACLNLARVSHSFYKYGDGHGVPDRATKDNIMSVLIQPVPVN
uniref:Terpene synthase n=1 Tax=Psidium guajava TaxID=120290 RepID=A0AA95ZAL3_PSIGU|nr:terpene synthase [Psidium guajava]